MISKKYLNALQEPDICFGYLRVVLFHSNQWDIIIQIFMHLKDFAGKHPLPALKSLKAQN